jgi:serine/threonine protein kinase
MHEFVGQLGTGGQASVHLVQNQLTGQQLACKVYKVKPTSNMEKLKEFINEVKIMRQIRYKSIINFQSYQVVQKEVEKKGKKEIIFECRIFMELFESKSLENFFYQ